MDSLRLFREESDAALDASAAIRIKSRNIHVQTLSWKDAIRKRHGML